MAIAALILWVLTASAGVSLLSSSRAARGAAVGPAQPPGAAGDPARPADAAGNPVEPTGAAGGPAQTDGGTGGAARPAGTPVRYAAVPLTEDGKPPPVPHVKVAAPPGGTIWFHSAGRIALTASASGLPWVIGSRPLAWIWVGILVVTLGAGLARWPATRWPPARRRRRPRLPAR